MLQDFGYSVSTVSDAATALNATAKRKFDLIVSDILMPGPINGLELARRIRQQAPRQAILLVTGYSESAASAKSEFLVLRKPYRQADLRQAITTVFDAQRKNASKTAP
jgi:two-component system NtrC family sensor kinase